MNDSVSFHRTVDWTRIAANQLNSALVSDFIAVNIDHEFPHNISYTFLECIIAPVKYLNKYNKRIYFRVY